MLNLVDDRVPVERLVLLHIASVSVSISQILECSIRSQCARWHCSVEPVNMVTIMRRTIENNKFYFKYLPDTVANGWVHESISSDCSSREKIHLEAGGRDQSLIIREQEQQEGNHGHAFLHFKSDWLRCSRFNTGLSDIQVWRDTEDLLCFCNTHRSTPESGFVYHHNLNVL